MTSSIRIRWLSAIEQRDNSSCHHQIAGSYRGTKCFRSQCAPHPFSSPSVLFIAWIETGSCCQLHIQNGPSKCFDGMSHSLSNFKFKAYILTGWNWWIHHRFCRWCCFGFRQESGSRGVVPFRSPAERQGWKTEHGWCFWRQIPRYS